MNPSRERAGRIRWHAVATGSVFLVAVAAIGDYYGYLVRFGGARAPATFDLTFVSPGEYRLWLVFTLLLIPGSLLVCNGFAGPLSNRLGEAARRLSGLEGRSRWLAGGSLFVGLVVLYRLGRRILLRDHMVTDDETAIRFGGQILAMGQLSVQRLWPPNTFSEIYTAALGDRIFATDWPGALIIAALAEIGPGALVYAFLAAAGCLAVCAAAERIAGRSAGWLAAVIWIVSPMVWTLSVTRHTHLVSRTFIAFAFLACAFLWCDRQQGAEANRAMRFGLPLLLGASVGFAFLCRPVETAAVMAPAGVYLVWRAIQGPRLAREQLVFAALALLPFLAAMAVYNQLQTGSALLPPRSLARGGALVTFTISEMTLWERLGANLSFNLMMLAVWFLGILGLPLAYLGTLYPGVLPRLCLLGVALQLLVALAHENVGIHLVGPIHYSESAVPLILLACAGTTQLAARLSSAGLVRFASPSLLGYGLALTGFGLLYAPSLAGLGRVADIPHAAAARAGVHHAIVLSPPLHELERMTPGSTGSWQHLHSPPDPELEDDVLFVDEDVDLAKLRRALPNRAYYRLVRERATGRFEVRPIHAER